jgi:hypothetical protein
VKPQAFAACARVTLPAGWGLNVAVIDAEIPGKLTDGMTELLISDEHTLSRGERLQVRLYEPPPPGSGGSEKAHCTCPEVWPENGAPWFRHEKTFPYSLPGIPPGKSNGMEETLPDKQSPPGVDAQVCRVPAIAYLKMTYTLQLDGSIWMPIRLYEGLGTNGPVPDPTRLMRVVESVDGSYRASGELRLMLPVPIGGADASYSDGGVPTPDSAILACPVACSL